MVAMRRRGGAFRPRRPASVFAVRANSVANPVQPKSLSSVDQLVGLAPYPQSLQPRPRGALFLSSPALAGALFLSRGPSRRHAVTCRSLPLRRSLLWVIQTHKDIFMCDD